MGDAGSHVPALTPASPPMGTPRPHNRTSKFETSVVDLSTGRVGNAAGIVRSILEDDQYLDLLEALIVYVRESLPLNTAITLRGISRRVGRVVDRMHPCLTAHRLARRTLGYRLKHRAECLWSAIQKVTSASNGMRDMQRARLYSIDAVLLHPATRWLAREYIEDVSLHNPSDRPPHTTASILSRIVFAIKVWVNYIDPMVPHQFSECTKVAMLRQSTKMVGTVMGGCPSFSEQPAYLRKMVDETMGGHHTLQAITAYMRDCAPSPHRLWCKTRIKQTLGGGLLDATDWPAGAELPILAHHWAAREHDITYVLNWAFMATRPSDAPRGPKVLPNLFEIGQRSGLGLVHYITGMSRLEPYVHAAMMLEWDTALHTEWGTAAKRRLLDVVTDRRDLAIMVACNPPYDRDTREDLHARTILHATRVLGEVQMVREGEGGTSATKSPRKRKLLL